MKTSKEAKRLNIAFTFLLLLGFSTKYLFSESQVAVKNKRGDTLLHKAACEDDIDTAKALIANGV